MTKTRAKAEAALVATAAHMALAPVRGEDFAMWLRVLREVLPDCEGGGPQLIAVKVSAAVLVEAPDTHARTIALDRLRIEIANHFRKAAAQRVEAFREASEGEVLDGTA